MYLVYLDESGDPTPLPRSNTPFYIISALIVEPDLMRSIEEKIMHIKKYLENRGINTAKMDELKGSEIWRRIKKKYEGGVDEAKNVFHGVYDIVGNSGFTIITVAIDKEKYVNATVLGEKLSEAHKALTSIVDQIKGSPYFSVLGNPNIGQQVLKDLNDGFNELASKFIGSIIKYQATNDVLVRIIKFLEREDERALLLFDADAKTISSSIYGFLAYSFREDGIALRHDSLIQPERIVHYLLIDSKLDYALQLTDIIAYGIREILQFKDKEVYWKLEQMFDKGYNGEIWGFGFKVIPWRKEDLDKILQ